jgi:predicted GTPase
MAPITVLIMGAGGRDFHNFNVVFRDDPRYEVVAFTAAQIPNIKDRTYPPALAGARYPRGIPIVAEEELEALLAARRIDQVVFAYSDVSHEEVMHRAARVIAQGSDFRLLGARSTMLKARRPVVSVCAVRTGCGKSPAARRLAAILKAAGLRVAVVRHPMAYGDLAAQTAQRFETLEDLARAGCTVEEMEEYEPHVRAGNTVYAGVDYARVLELAEPAADVLLWDGGNNDLPLLAPDLEIVLVDPHRAGHERTYFPGEANLLRAQVVVIAKLDTADPAKAAALRASVRAANPGATIVESAMPATVESPERVRGARVLVIEDGPTLTHGGMRYGAGVLAAQRLGARELVDPRPFAVGSIGETFARYPHIGALLPAMGYGPAQVAELSETIARVDCDVVLIATPVDLRRVIAIRQPALRLTYELRELGTPSLEDVLRPFIAKVRGRG